MNGELAIGKKSVKLKFVAKGAEADFNGKLEQLQKAFNDLPDAEKEKLLGKDWQKVLEGTASLDADAAKALSTWAESHLGSNLGIQFAKNGEKAMFALEHGFRFGEVGYNFSTKMHGTPMVMARGAGTALGAVMAIDALGRGKKGDGEDRGWVGRVAEGAGGVGIGVTGWGAPRVKGIRRVWPTRS